tara:strand:- start:1496 stop:1771 length:276 start_codon:yes stop_codon:yes gene_type:complete
MPTYDYKCKDCGNSWDEHQSISARNVPRYNPCPECGASGNIVLVIGKVNLGDSIQLGVKKPPADVENRLREIQKEHPNMKQGRHGQNITEV